MLLAFISNVVFCFLFVNRIFCLRFVLFLGIHADHDAIVDLIVVVELVLSIRFSHLVAELDDAPSLDGNILADILLEEVFVCDC